MADLAKKPLIQGTPPAARRPPVPNQLLEPTYSEYTLQRHQVSRPLTLGPKGNLWFHIELWREGRPAKASPWGPRAGWPEGAF